MADRTYWSYSGYGFSHLTYFEKKAGFFSSGIKKELKALYFYEEGDSFYEFFTGAPLGKRITQTFGYGFIEAPESTIRIPLSGSRSANRLSAAQFVECVKPYMEDKALVTKAVSDFLNSKHLEWLEIDRKKRLQEIEQQRKESESTSWLDSILDSRK